MVVRNSQSGIFWPNSVPHPYRSTRFSFFSESGFGHAGELLLLLLKHNHLGKKMNYPPLRWGNYPISSRRGPHLDSGDHEGGGVRVRSGVAAGQHPGTHVSQNKVLVRERSPVDRNPTRSVVPLRRCGDGGEEACQSSTRRGWCAIQL